MEQTLERFVRAQKDMYETARQELLNKKKEKPLDVVYLSTAARAWS